MPKPETLSPYIDQVYQTLPRLLALYNPDRTSASYGMGNRIYWAWGLIDFANGTFQGAANGLSLLLVNHLLPDGFSENAMLRRIDAMFTGTDRIRRKDGSLEEAFPYEGSYCVTALAAFDLLCAMKLLKSRTESDTWARWQTVIHPMIDFLIRADETHALISNHLATASACLFRWHALTGDSQAENKARLLLNRILQNQSAEGWFTEYQGADPGYQTVCMYYLADVHRQRPDIGLLEPLTRSVRFLWHFAHPDGSFGGLYGSRCTRFYNPAGMEALANEIPEALALADYMAGAIAQSRMVTLSSIDEPNLIPWFNAYTWAAVLFEKRRQVKQEISLVPCMQKQYRRAVFEQAGLFIDQGPDHYTIISTHKGGVVYHFQDGRLTLCDAGVVVRTRKNELASTQTYAPENEVQWLDDNTLTVDTQFCLMPRRLPKPMEFLALRLPCVSVFRFLTLREFVKRILVKVLITGKNPLPAGNIRTIRLGYDLTMKDHIHLPFGYEKVDNLGPFVSIHMASQGYWQVQDEDSSAIVLD